MSEPGAAVPTPVFHRSGVRLLIGTIAASLLVSAFLVVFGYDLDYGQSAANDSYSSSALGHRGFRGLLERLRLPVLSSRNRTSRRAADTGVLIVAEPDSATGLRSLLLTAEATLVVLPKWSGVEDPSKPGWLASVHPKTAGEVEAVLDAITEDAGDLALVRTTAPTGRWRSVFGNRAPDPVLPAPQLIRGDTLTPLVECDAGVLLGVLRLPDAAGPVYVLADPDCIANHGLPRGGNALLAVRAVERMLGPDGGPVVFEETVHGHTAHPSVWRALFRFPLMLVTLQAVLAAALLVWLAAARFGAPLDALARLSAGKRYLITHLAAVQRLNGHTPEALRRYYRSTVQLVARRLHAPPQVEGAALESWLARTEGARRPSRLLADVRRAVIDATNGPAARARLTAAARAVHHWREEMLRGS